MTDKMQKGSKSMSLPIAVVGSGPVGLLSALSLAQRYEQIILIGPQLNLEDGRTSALMMPAIGQLDQLGLWDELEKRAASLSCLRIIDATKRLIRAPSITFRASEIGEKAFGYNIPNKELNAILYDKVKTSANIIWHPHHVEHYQHNHDHVKVVLDTGLTLKASLIVAADGRNSPARASAGIKVWQWHYPQTALVTNFSHQYSHQNTSHEFHTAQGPFTQVPLPGLRSSLVWVLNPQEAKRLLGLGSQALACEIEKNMESMLGKISLDETSQDWPPQAWPMAALALSQFAARRTVLIGEAAHVFPPIGAQGLNLGLRDIAELDGILCDETEDAGSDRVLTLYNRRRRPDIWARTGFVHALNRVLLSDFLPFQLVRSAGLEALRQWSPLRNWLMREGLTPGGGFKSCMPTRALP